MINNCRDCGKEISKKAIKCSHCAKIGHNNMLGKPKSEITKERIRQSLIGRFSGINNPMYGKKFTEEHRKKLSMARRKRITKDETRKKISLGLTGRPVSESTRLKHKSFRHSKKYKDKMSLARMGNKNPMFGKKLSNEHIEKLKSINRGNKYCVGNKHTEIQKEKMRAKRLFQVFPVKDTSIEIKLQNALTNRNIEFKKHVPIFGQPDLLIGKNIALFADGCWFHCCDKCYDIHKFGDLAKKRRDRDKLVTQTLVDQGYLVIRIWEHEINNNLDECIDTIKPLFSTFFNKDKFQEVQING